MKIRLSELIAQSEGDYNSYNRGNAGDSVKKKVAISEMSIKDVRRFQGLDVGDSKRFFAVGKYQIIPGTMDELFDKHKFKADQDLAFSPEVQEAMFMALISKKRPNVHKYITAENMSKSAENAAVKALANEWASIENPETEGQMLSVHGGVGGNKANISAAKVKAALLEERALYQSHIKSGLLPQDAFALLTILPNNYIKTRLTELKTEKTGLTAEINVAKGQEKTILELGEHLKSHSFDNLKDVQKLDALAKTAGIELVTPAEAILADKKTIN